MKKTDKLYKECHHAINEIEEGFKELHKSGVKKLPKSILNGLNKVDKQFKKMEKMFKKDKK